MIELSPCIKVCKLSDDKICVGCGRTIDEIMNWNIYDENIKREIKFRARSRTTQKNFKFDDE